MEAPIGTRVTRGDGVHLSPLMMVFRGLAVWGHRWFHWVPAFLALALYVRTLAPDVFVSDFAEFQYQPLRLGLPHPNGFPFYMLLGWAWSHLPWQTVAWRMNVLSALGGALAVAITSHFARRLSGRATVGCLAGTLLALSPTFWGYSLAAERYTLNLALLVAAMWLAWEAAQHPAQTRRWVPLSALALGLGLAVHPSDLLLAPFWAVYLLWRVPGVRRPSRLWVTTVLALAGPLLLYAYVPWRWAAYARWPLVPGVGRSLAVYQGLVHVWYEPPLRWDLVTYYITGLGGYATGLVEGGWREALARTRDLAPVWQAEIPLGLALLALVGLPRVFRREGVLTVLLLGFAAFLTLMVAYIQQGKNEAYLLPAFWVVLFTAAFAADWPLPTRLTALRGLLPFLAALLLLPGQYAQRDLSRRMDLRQWWAGVLQVPIENGAAFLGHWSDFTPLWYLQQIDGWRPDLIALFPPDVDTVIQPWLDTGGTLYLAAPTHGWAPDLAERYTLVPWGRLVRILPRRQSFSCFERLKTPPQHQAGPLTLSAFTWSATTLTPGRVASLLFCWRTEAPLPRDVFVNVRLTPTEGGPSLDINGPLVIGWDPRPTIPAGSEGLGQVVLSVPQGTWPGVYRAEVSFFRLPSNAAVVPFANGVVLDAGQVRVSPTRRFSRHLLAQETAPLLSPRVGPLVLRAWSLSPGPVRPGDPVLFEALWEVREAPSADLRLQARFWGPSARGRVTSPERLFPPFLRERLTPGMLIRTRHTWRAPRGLGDRTYVVEVRVLAGERRLTWWPTGRWLAGLVRVQDRPHRWQAPPDITPVDATWSGVARLLGYRLEPATPVPGRPLTVVLYWQALAPVETPYKVFVHFVGPDGRILAQHDAFPANNTLPTDLWVPGEVIEDPHPLTLPSDLPPGAYTLRVGLYHPDTLQRLPVRSSLPVRDRALDLWTWAR